MTIEPQWWSLEQKDGFVIPEVVIGNPLFEKINEFRIPTYAGMTTKLANGSFWVRLDGNHSNSNVNNQRRQVTVYFRWCPSCIPTSRNILR
jgi:hypothetical protein